MPEDLRKFSIINELTLIAFRPMALSEVLEKVIHADGMGLQWIFKNKNL